MKDEILIKIKEKVEEIHEGVQNLKCRTNFDSLMHKERLWEIESGINKFRKHNEIDGLHHALNIFKETSIFFPEGSDAYNVTIWDASVQARGKMTTLDELFPDLDELIVECQK